MAYAVNNPKGLTKLFEEMDPDQQRAPVEEVTGKWWTAGSQAASSAGSK